MFELAPLQRRRRRRGKSKALYQLLRRFLPFSTPLQLQRQFFGFRKRAQSEEYNEGILSPFKTPTQGLDFERDHQILQIWSRKKENIAKSEKNYIQWKALSFILCMIAGVDICCLFYDKIKPSRISKPWRIQGENGEPQSTKYTDWRVICLRSAKLFQEQTSHFQTLISQ